MSAFSRLCRSELHRIFARRITLVIALVYAALIVAIVLISYAQHSADSGAGLREAQQEQSRLIEDCLRAGAESVDGPTPDECAGIEVVAEDQRWTVTDTHDMVRGVVALGGLLVFVLGASAGGAEWAARTLHALLFWEPRRVRVIGAKVLALSGVVVLVGVLGQLLTVAGAWFVTVTRGTTAGYTRDAWLDIVTTQGYGLLLLALAAVAAFSVSSLTRNTAAALGAAFGYLVIFEPLMFWWRPSLVKYLLTPNIGALVDGSFTDPATSTAFGAGRCGLVLTLYVAALLGAATALFVRRDVT